MAITTTIAIAMLIQLALAVSKATSSLEIFAFFCAFETAPSINSLDLRNDFQGAIRQNVGLQFLGFDGFIVGSHVSV